MKSLSDVATVTCITPNLIQIEVMDPKGYKELDRKLEIGSYIQVSDSDQCNPSFVAIVQSYRVKDQLDDSSGETESRTTFIVEAQRIGRIHNSEFRRGGQQVTIPPNSIEILPDDALRAIYGTVDGGKAFSFGALAQNPEIRVALDGDKFFGRHIGVVGSTGSGKSCTVAKLIQEGSRRSRDQTSAGILNNSHIMIFDLHGEYSSAFPDARIINTESLVLPYWLMNSEELEEMFIESGESNSHNQVSQFRQAVVENKRRHTHCCDAELSYDSPSYFSLKEVVNYLANLNAEVVGKLPGENCPKLAEAECGSEDGRLIRDRPTRYFDTRLAFVEASTAKGDKAKNGPFNGEFDRFLMRLESKISDRRLRFLLAPTKRDGSDYKTDDFVDLLHQLTGYGSPSRNVSIVDLSGIPFEVLSVVVSLMTRLIFTFCFHLKRAGKVSDRELPFLLVYEEAHNYIPPSSSARYGSVRKAIERVSKEGRKYGISLMIVSQRPSEISETVFSQCNNFVAMRLTNPNDQNYVKRLLPDAIGAITDMLPSLEKQEAIVIGDSLPIPSLVRVDDIVHRPDSLDVDFYREWKRDWLDAEFEAVIQRWQ